jgi:hypothetical protein
MPTARKPKAAWWACGNCGQINSVGRRDCSRCGSIPIGDLQASALPAKLPSKFKNQWTEYAGVRFQSKAEADYCAQLDLRIAGHDLVSYRRQVPIALMVGGKLICRLVIDFELRHNDGSLEFVDVKGFPTPTFKIKWRLFDAIFPQFKKTIVQQ